MIGRRLAHFDVTAKLGEGGMGEVYRATDTRLGREVAIKVLPGDLGADPERLARFDREARVLASLNHPAIAAIHAVESEESLHFLVMELVEGEDLAKRIARAPLPLDQTLAIALQIAEGLEFAHERGVVHRDLKPANVMLAPDERVKILDFGLAKALEEPGSALDVDLSASPTLTAQMTRRGVLLGTAGYMSPEQARGAEVDKRVDIWAFGVVVYEMLVGKRLFDGPSLTDVLAAVMRAEIDLDELPADVPAGIRALLARCLDRDPRTRLRDIGEARIGIGKVLSGEDAPDDAGTTAGDDAPAPTGLRRLAPWLAAVLGIGASLVFGSLYFDRPQASTAEEVVHSSIQLPQGVRLAGWSSPAVAISPDERTIAFVGHQDGRQQLYLRPLDESEAVAVPGSDGAEGPFFSPDSRWVGFGAGAISGRSTEPRLLKRAPVAGGEAQQVVALNDYVGGSWGNDGYIYYADGFVRDHLRRVRETGGEPERLFEDARGGQLAEILAAWPQHIDDGRRLLLTSFRTAGHRVVILDLGTGAIADLDQPSTFARYASSGHLIFVGNDGVLRAAPFEPRSGRRLGAPVAMVRDVAFTCNQAAVFAIGGRGTALFATGFVRGSDRVLSRLVRIDPADGSVERLPFEPDAFLRGVSLSPDGRRLAAATWDGSLWIYDLTRRTRLRFPDGGVHGKRLRPRWSPDGSTIAYTLEDPDQGGAHLYAQAADGTGEARRLAGEPGEAYATGWTPDGGEVIYWDYTGGYRVSASGDRPAVQLGLGAGHSGNVSPDGRWLAYHSRESGRREVYLQPFPDGGAVTPVSSGGGTSPQWSLDGDELYYDEGCRFFAVPVKRSPSLVLGDARLLFEHCDPSRRGGSQFDVDAEGFFYMLEAVPESGVVTSLQLVQNWDRTVRAALGDSN